MIYYISRKLTIMIRGLSALVALSLLGRCSGLSIILTLRGTDNTFVISFFKEFGGK